MFRLAFGEIRDGRLEFAGSSWQSHATGLRVARRAMLDSAFTFNGDCIAKTRAFQDADL